MQRERKSIFMSQKNIDKEKRNAYSRRYYARIKAAGLCRCGQPLEPGYSSCTACREKNRQKTAERREAAKAAGYCVCCYSRPTMEGYATCQKCAERNRKNALEWYYRKNDKA